ncbi:hypothetical protein [Streptomyces sp. NEAU-W12]|uniref:hypothetical protein n=1 Tax=Streptomyces sp. NEAU-W12 TaxID=2994668 RepID=UPI00224AAA75|nr:hypothetical protein [Streptomyces sp. NEAU-W12]MCX2925144.1 hypothetical protein [Streptomyces sp. NEAU-W12]
MAGDDKLLRNRLNRATGYSFAMRLVRPTLLGFRCNEVMSRIRALSVVPPAASNPKRARAGRALGVRAVGTYTVQ